MKEFTFAIVTYNQRSLIVEHLESVKWQIEHYGQDYETDLVLSDDGSKDDTVAVAQKWIDQHRHLFRNVKILAAEKNQGVVPNFLKMVGQVETAYFKPLAGDDYYYSNNVYEAAYGKDFVLTPTLQLFGSRVNRDQNRWLYKEYLFTPKNKLRYVVRKRLEYQLSLETPGVAWSTNLVDEGMYAALKEYQWIEDVPLWHYLLGKEIEVTLWEKPIVIYRMNTGISQNGKHEKFTVFDEEVLKLEREIQVHMNNRLYRYKRAIAKRIIKYFCSRWFAVHRFDEGMAKTLEEADAYVATIAQAAQTWMKNNT